MRAKAKTKPKMAASRAPAGGATMFDDISWGTPIEAIAASVGMRREAGVLALGAPDDRQRAVHGDLSVSRRELVRISLSRVRRYADSGESDGYENAAVGWVESYAGPRTERRESGAKWLVPMVKIWIYCDASLGIYYEQPPAS